MNGCTLISALALALYDMSISISREVQYVWRKKLSVVTVLYTMTRYGTIISTAMVLLQLMHASRSITVSGSLIQ